MRSGFLREGEGEEKKERDALARDIDDNAQSTIRSSFGDEFRSDKLGNRLGEVDAVDENVDIEDFGEWTALGRFGHVPLDDVFPNYQQGVSQDDEVFSRKDVLGNTGLPEKVNSTGSTSSQGANDQHLYPLLAFLGALQRLAHFLDHLTFVGVRLQFAQLALTVLGLLSGKGEGTGGSTGETGVETECGDTSVGNGVFEEFKVVKGALALGESAEDIVPSALVLVAVGELDVRVGKGIAALQDMKELVKVEE